jgi:hypothetical protein
VLIPRTVLAHGPPATLASARHRSGQVASRRCTAYSIEHRRKVPKDQRGQAKSGGPRETGRQSGDERCEGRAEGGPRNRTANGVSRERPEHIGHVVLYWRRKSARIFVRQYESQEAKVYTYQYIIFRVHVQTPTAAQSTRSLAIETPARQGSTAAGTDAVGRCAGPPTALSPPETAHGQTGRRPGGTP